MNHIVIRKKLSNYLLGLLRQPEPVEQERRMDVRFIALIE